MELLGFIFIFSLFSITSYFLWKQITTIITSSVERMFERTQKSNELLYDLVTQMQVDHFKSLEKSTEKQVAAIDKQTKEFLRHLFPIQKEEINPVKNLIEKEEEKDIPLTEDIKIPILNGMKVKFEDEESIIPVSIS